MTALKPLENRRVRGVAAERYPLNEHCSHPRCKEHAVDPHHIFPRSEIGGDSWFVAIDDDKLGHGPWPHVTGLCRTHHDDLEEHRAWIKIEEGFIYVWYVRKDDEWLRLGALNPQPPSGDPKAKKAVQRPRKTGEERRQRGTVTLRVPKDADEDGAGLLDDAIELAEEYLSPESPRSPYYTIMDALNAVILGNVEKVT